MSFTAERCPAEYPHLAHDWRSAAWVRCPGIRIPDELRAQRSSVRRHVLAELRSIKDQLAHKVSRWAVTGVEYDDDRWVPRRVADFPENSVISWGALARTCRDLQEDLETLAAFADARAREVAAFNKTAAAREGRTGRAGRH